MKAFLATLIIGAALYYLSDKGYVFANSECHMAASPKHDAKFILTCYREINLYGAH